MFAAAVEAELAALLKGLGFRTKPPAQGTWSRLDSAGRPLHLLTTGVGPVASGIALGRFAQSLSGPYCLVNVGIAGSFDLDRAGLGALVAADTETFADFGLWTDSGVDPTGIRFGQGADAKGNVVYNRLEIPPTTATAVLGVDPLDVLGVDATGPGLTVAAASGTLRRADELKRRHDPLFESMEGFALALCAVQTGGLFLEIRAISNRVGRRPPVDWDIPKAFRAISRLGERFRPFCALRS